MNNRKLLSLIVLFLCCQYFQAQQSTPSEAFDAIVRLENTDLASGTEYIEQHIIRNNKHKYFLGDQFETGTVIYDGQTYRNVSLKYNLFDDLILVQLKTSGGEAIFQLHTQNVEEFSLMNHRFLHIRLPANLESEIGGFYEVLDETSGMLLKKHLKKQLKHLDRDFLYFEFEPEKPQYVFFYNNKYYPINSRRDVQELYPDNEKVIRRYYRANKSLSKTDKDRFLANLFKTIPPTVTEH